MKDIIDIINEKEAISSSKSATNKEISNAEYELSLSFAEEYKRYITIKGFIIYDGHELTGICSAKRLNVVDVTKNEKAITSNIPNDWYVIEQLNIDGIVIWQSSLGEIYQTAPGTAPIKICNSLAEYIEGN